MEVIIVDTEGLRITSSNGVIHVSITYPEADLTKKEEDND